MNTSPTPATPSPEQKMREILAKLRTSSGNYVIDDAVRDLTALQSSGCLKAEGATGIQSQVTDWMPCVAGQFRKVAFALGESTVELISTFKYHKGAVFRVRDVITGREDVVGSEFIIDIKIPPASHQPAPISSAPDETPQQWADRMLTEEGELPLPPRSPDGAGTPETDKEAFLVPA